MASKSKEKLKLELEFKRYALTISTLGGIIVKAIPAAAVVAIAYFASQAIIALAGKETFADFSIKAVATYIGKNTTLAEVVEITVILGLLIWGFAERKLRKDVIERGHARIQQLESKLDPDRTSSELTPRGSTREGDKP